MPAPPARIRHRTPPPARPPCACTLSQPRQGEQARNPPGLGPCPCGCRRGGRRPRGDGPDGRAMIASATPGARLHRIRGAWTPVDVPCHHRNHTRQAIRRRWLAREHATRVTFGLAVIEREPDAVVRAPGKCRYRPIEPRRPRASPWQPVPAAASPSTPARRSRRSGGCAPAGIRRWPMPGCASCRRAGTRSTRWWARRSPRSWPSRRCAGSAATPVSPCTPPATAGS